MLEVVWGFLEVLLDLNSLGLRNNWDLRHLTEVFIALTLLYFLLSISFIPVTYLCQKFAIPLLPFIESHPYLIEKSLHNPMSIDLPSLDIIQADCNPHLVVSTCSPNSMPEGIILPRVEEYHQIKLDIYSSGEKVRCDYYFAFVDLVH